MSAGASAAAAAAAARKRAEMRQEEERMTGYGAGDLDGWEFKILRSATSSFRNPAVLQRILEEEARAGWELVEKFDNSRVRLKRRVESRRADAGLGLDAYRTHVGISEARLGLTIAACIVLGVVTVSLLIILLK